MTNETTASQPKSIEDRLSICPQCEGAGDLHCRICEGSGEIPAWPDCSLKPKSIGDDAQDDSAFLKHWDSTTHEYGADVFDVAYKAARAAWFAAPAAQASATIQAAPDKCHWCPECGSEKSTPTGYDNGNYCSDCGQEWFPDIDYTDAIRQNLAVFKQRPLAATIQEPVMVADLAGVALDKWPVHYVEGLENGGYYLRTDVIRGLAATVKAVPSEALICAGELVFWIDPAKDSPDRTEVEMYEGVKLVTIIGSSHKFGEYTMPLFAAPLADKKGGGE